MQRKTGILKERSGFAMIMAIFFMILIATLLSYMLASSSETAKRTTNDYLNEQAQLLAKSAVEYTILRVSGHNRAGGCMLGFTGNYPTSGATAIFDINVTVQYFGFGNACAQAFTDAGRSIANIQTSESNGTMMIDVYVSDNINLKLTEPIRYHRRTLQKL